VELKLEMVNYKRHILKSISYRILGTFITILLAIWAGLPIKWAGIVGVGELIIKPIVYFLHERFWYKWINYGINNKMK
jgi:uncharacterized membrane protein